MRIFICYRRDESKVIVGRIYDRLTTAFGIESVFKDDHLPPGTDFKQVLSAEISRSDVMLVIIGRQWASIKGGFGKRLDDPVDHVRAEVEQGLQREDILIIPVCVGGASIASLEHIPPSLQPLRFKNARTARDEDFDFRQDMDRLIGELKNYEQVIRETRIRLQAVEQGMSNLPWAEITQCLDEAEQIAAQQPIAISVKTQREYWQKQRERSIDDLLDRALAYAKQDLEHGAQARALVDHARRLAISLTLIEKRYVEIRAAMRYWEKEAEQSKTNQFLSKEFGFSFDELTLNREGKVGEAQVRRIRHAIIKQVLLFAFSGTLLFLMFGTIPLWYSPTYDTELTYSNPLITLFVVLGVLGLVVVLAILSFRRILINKPLPELTVKSETNPLRFYKSGKTQDGEPDVQIEIGAIRRKLPYDTWAAMRKYNKGDTFRAYYVRYARRDRILSIEVWQS